jgi:SAM-dependent methyltransferase
VKLGLKGCHLIALIVLACEAKPDVSAVSARPADPPPEAARAPDVLYIPTPQAVVDEMLELARVKPGDLVYDLGCGDGRIVVTAAQRYGARAVGFDIDPERVAEAEDNVRKAGVGGLVRIEQRDIFTLDLAQANIVTLYLLPELNVKLIPQLERMLPGSRVISHDFDIAGVEPLQALTLRADDTDHTVYVFEIPLKKQR